MPSRNKRNVTSRRHRPTSEDLYLEAQPRDLISFESHPPLQTTYDTMTPAVFELEPPPSDPEVGRASMLIRDQRDPRQLLSESMDFANEMYGPGTSESDVDDGGPVSPSTSPPGPSSLGDFAIPDIPTASHRSIRMLAPEEHTTSEGYLARSIGHVRSPVLARRSRRTDYREPTPLETFSRTIRNYVPSSIPIPSAGPSPPRVSRPVSFGSFLSPSALTTVPPIAHESDYEWKRRGNDTSSQADPLGRRDGRLRSDSGAGEMAVFSLDDDVPEDGLREDNRRITRYPGVGDTEEILWAGWDSLVDVSDENGEPSKTRSVLMVGYPSGLQLWDCSNLGSVAELLNLAGARWGAVEFAGVLPAPSHGLDDTMRPKRPLIGFSSRTLQGTDFLVYSLRTHEVVKRLSLIGLTSFAASSQFIILCTSNPSTLHIISACTLATLYIIPSASLVSFTFPTASTSPTNAKFNDVSSIDIDQRSRALQWPRPIYALSNRFLAYVSPLPRHDVVPSATPGQAHTSAPTAPPEAPPKFGLGMSQADLGNAAVKVGGRVLNGMKTLGGIAFSAARAGVSAAVSGEQQQSHTRSPSSSGSGTAAGALGVFFSKSAPAATGSPHQYQTAADRRRHSFRVSSSGFDSQATVIPGSLPPPPISPTLQKSGCNVLVVDLQPLLGSVNAQPEPIAKFTFSRPQALSSLKFSTDGTTLAICSKDGHAVRVFQLRPAPKIVRRSSSELSELPSQEPRVKSDKERRPSQASQELRKVSSSEAPEYLSESMQHVYTLRRGRTSAVVESLEWAHDNLWFGMSTRKRTIHVFAVNPLGGRPDGSSHLAGKVVNSSEVVSSSTELSPLVRVRLKSLSPDAVGVPCAFTFLRSSETTLPQSLLPPASVHFSTSSSPSSVASSGLSKPVSPAQRPTRPTNFKDLLVFDPMDGTLVLHRIFVERSAEQAVVPGSIPVGGGISISLPGMSALGRMGTSPPGPGTSPRVASGLTQMMEKSSEIIGRDNIIGTWSLVRGRGWPEVKQSLRQSRVGSVRTGRTARADWLSRAELSTFSSSPRILPRLIYLSHQFSFHVLGEDYHALIRSYHFDVPSSKIDVRKPIEVSAFATNDGEAAFAQDLSSHHDIGLVASSFDEPLASALSAPLHPLNPSPPVLPMLPNGTPGSGSKSLMNAIPIRQVAAGIQDGMSEGLGRIRRELSKARSPRLAARRDSTISVPLEFDEEDEDFLVRDTIPGTSLDGDRGLGADFISRSASASTGTGIGGGDSGASISTPSTNIDPLPVEDDGEQTWEGWGPEDQQAVEDAERFDDITVGFLDEEQETMRETAVKKKNLGKKRRVRKA